MRRALPDLAAAAIGASLVLPFLPLSPQVMEPLEEQRPAATDVVTVVMVVTSMIEKKA